MSNLWLDAVAVIIMKNSNIKYVVEEVRTTQDCIIFHDKKLHGTQTQLSPPHPI